jgi:hypothetical protein
MNFSSRLLNFVEPTIIGGFTKTTFYSEISTNFQVGDRIFIVNGNYDSNEKIKEDKYGKYSDGYRVLQVDGTRITLDIDYTFKKPYEDYNYGSFSNVWNTKTKEETDYQKSIKIALSNNSHREGKTPLVSKFDGELNGDVCTCYSNNILFDGTFSIVNQTKDFSINDTFLSGNLFFPNISWNERIFILGEDISLKYNEKDYFFRENNAYKFVDGEWIIDITYKQPYISKINFRSGYFKGTHNDGVFGTNETKNSFDGANWNGGCLINSEWLNGVMNSKTSPGTIFNTSILSNNQIVTALDSTNLNGKGPNFGEDSSFIKGIINGGSFINCNIIPDNTNKNPVKDVLESVTTLFDISVNNSIFRRSDFNSSSINNSDIVNSNVKSSSIKSSNVSNSTILTSYMNNSRYRGDGDIKVIKSEIWSYQTNLDVKVPIEDKEGSVRGILKLYISDEDLLKLGYNNSFYLNINKNRIIRFLTEDEKILLPIETRWIFNKYFNNEISEDEIIVSLKNKNDNKSKIFAEKYGDNGNYVNIEYPEESPLASIDIDSSLFAYWLNGGLDSLITFSSKFNWINKSFKDTIVSIWTLFNKSDDLFKDMIIRNSDYISGYINNSEWLDGDNINFYSNIIKKRGVDALNITKLSEISDIQVSRTNLKINGIDPETNDIVWLQSITHNQTMTDISGPYALTSGYSGSITLKNLYDTINGLPTNSGTFSTIKTEGNTYTSLHPLKIKNSTISNGLFKRTNLENSKVINNKFDNTDISLSWDNIKRLRLINILFNNTFNTVSNGLIYKSHFAFRNDTSGGIFYNSILNDSLFDGGLFRSSYWLDGEFKSGKFLDNNDTQPTSLGDFDNGSYTKSWLKGTFTNGEFVNSLWINGTFNGGSFYRSKWLSGEWNNGRLGKQGMDESETTLGFFPPVNGSTNSTIWRNGVVDNAVVGGSGSVYWYGGKFNYGSFISNFPQGSLTSSIWYDGEFNGGKFYNFAKWKNGKFNGGKFLSKWGSTSWTSSNIADYSWENGEFNNGEFGNGTFSENSTWFGGEFNGGIFQGKVWNNGIFFNGTLNGSLDYTKGLTLSVQLFGGDNFWGLWRNGWVVDDKTIVNTNKKTLSVQRTVSTQTYPLSKINNSLWINGTFSHDLGSFNNSVWLSGSFNKGNFNSSYFNPFLDHTLTNITASFNTSSNCVWNNGNFDGVEFNYSEWKNGTFKSGTMNGGIWRNGTWLNGNANNIYWENGTWRNGNWNSAPYGFDKLTNRRVTDLKTNQILLNIASALGTNSLFITNAFTISGTMSLISNPTFSTGTGFESWTFSFE